MKNKINALIAIVTGLLVAIGPRTFIPICEFAESGMHMEMEDSGAMVCYYTAQTLLGIGILLVILGVISLLSSNRCFLTGIFTANLLNGIYIIAVVYGLIGTCKSLHANCYLLTRPAVTVLSALLIISNLLVLICAYREMEEK